MVRRKLMLGSTMVRTMMKTRTTTPAAAAAITAEQNENYRKYIDTRVNNVFNIILGEINNKHNSHSATTSGLPDNSIFRDPYKHKDLILQKLVNSQNTNENYNIHDLIEDEFQLEISDEEFARFKSLTDIVNYVNQRYEIKRQMLPFQPEMNGVNMTY